MSSNYNYTENGVVYSFDDVFVPYNIFDKGNLWTWGFNDSGQLEINNTTNRSVPVTTFNGRNDWKQVDCGSYYAAGIKLNGTLWLWGDNGDGQLGVNNITNRLTAVTTFAGGTDWKQVACGYHHTAAIKKDGTLWTWGDNSYYQLGNNTTTNRSTPVTTFAGGTNWNQVVCGGFFTAAIKDDGTLWLWGDNDGAQLGINSSGRRLTPVTTFAGGTNWKKIACGGYHISAIKDNGTLWTWGYNRWGQLGDNTTNSKSTPITVFGGGSNWNQIGCGGNSTRAIKTDGTLWVWGTSTSGSLGVNDTSTRITPVTTFAGGTNWKYVSSGRTSTHAIKTDGTLWTWGYNANGELGINDLISRSTPVTTFAGGTDWKQVNSGGKATSSPIGASVAAIQY